MSDNIRDGNRGGRGLFSWENVRVMSYKDRECYLGSTVNLGFLDKGGRWRKKDWWTRPREQNSTETLDEELRRVREEDDLKMQEALGGQVAKPRRKKSRLTSQDKSQLLTRHPGEIDGIDKEIQGYKVTGLGFDPANRVFGAKGADAHGLTDEALRLEGSTPGHAKTRLKDYKAEKQRRR
jgi:hypothetical protein